MGDTERRGGLSTSLKNLLARENADDEVRATLRDISPINRLYPGLPPFLLIHGTADKSVLFQQSVDFQARLKENRVPCDLITITNAPHSIAKWDDFDASYKDKLVDWLKRTLGASQL
jgi:alpha-L-fucosidase 2